MRFSPLGSISRIRKWWVGLIFYVKTGVSGVRWVDFVSLVQAYAHVYEAGDVQYINIFKISTQVNTKAGQALPATQTFVDVERLYLTTIIYVINGRTLCAISSIETPPSPERAYISSINF